MMDISHLVLLISTVVLLYVLGEIWFVQLVVYPLFAKVGTEEYVTYHRFYSSRILLPVILPGFASFFLPVAILFVRPETVSLWLVLANVLCGLLGLFVTVALEIPRHHQLEKDGKQEKVIRELILYNWPRTVSITGSAVLTVIMFMSAFSPI